jgi:hypothetical protein
MEDRTMIKLRKITIILSICLSVFLLPLSAYSGGVTKLSKKASRLKIGMSRQSVLTLLGRPTWAIIPGDSGDFSLPDPRLKLELYWKNPGCSPVVVQFNAGLKVTGWDEGRAYCGKDAHLLQPTDAYSCHKSDRVRFCK